MIQQIQINTLPLQTGKIHNQSTTYSQGVQGVWSSTNPLKVLVSKQQLTAEEIPV